MYFFVGLLLCLVQFANNMSSNHLTEQEATKVINSIVQISLVLLDTIIVFAQPPETPRQGFYACEQTKGTDEIK